MRKRSRREKFRWVIRYDGWMGVDGVDGVGVGGWKLLTVREKGKMNERSL